MRGQKGEGSKDLALSIQFVCEHWKDVSFTDELWDNITYYPNEDTSEKEIVAFLKKTPKLRRFRFDGIPQENTIFPALLYSCEDIRSWQVEFMPTLTLDQLDSLLVKYSKLESLMIRIESPNAKELVNKISACHNLKSLTLTGQCGIPGIFKPIVDGCSSLQHLSFGGGSPNCVDLLLRLAFQASSSLADTVPQSFFERTTLTGNVGEHVDTRSKKRLFSNGFSAASQQRYDAFENSAEKNFLSHARSTKITVPHVPSDRQAGFATTLTSQNRQCKRVGRLRLEKSVFNDLPGPKITLTLDSIFQESSHQINKPCSASWRRDKETLAKHLMFLHWSKSWITALRQSHISDQENL
uniref:Uncharacterized protein n=1 Tax=Timema poppense TaxID=170557 RepID=A0A7R9HCU3_TIMPO|nr:unnamed protein product [Timema poppensis]